MSSELRDASVRRVAPEVLTIGRFARLSGLTIRALRLYDELGLLRPTAVDGGSRYRYYTTGQLEQAELIGRLRRLDMALGEIGRFLDGQAGDRELILAGHRVRLSERVAAAGAAMRALDELMAGPSLPIQGRKRNVTPMVLMTLRELPVMRVRITLREDELRKNEVSPGRELPGPGRVQDWWSCMVAEYVMPPEVDAVVVGQGLARTGPPYFSCTEPDDKGIMRAEVGIPVDRVGATDGRVEPGVLPGGEVATAYYQGPYETLGVAYRQLWAEIEAAGLTANGDPREVYITAPRATPDPEDYGTHLVWPVTG